MRLLVYTDYALFGYYSDLLLSRMLISYGFVAITVGSRLAVISSVEIDTVLLAR